MPLVEGEYLIGVVPSREHDDRGLRQAGAETGVPQQDVPGLCDVCAREVLEAIDAAPDLVEKIELGAPTGALFDQLVKLCEHERREHERRSSCSQGVRRCEVTGLAWIDGGEEAARVEQDQSSPKPSASSSSTRSASVGSPELNRGIRGRGVNCASTTLAIPSRMSSASLRPDAAAARLRSRPSSSGRYTVVFFMPYIVPYVPRR